MVCCGLYGRLKCFNELKGRVEESCYATIRKEIEIFYYIVTFTNKKVKNAREQKILF